jgi:hypothetical protein
MVSRRSGVLITVVHLGAVAAFVAVKFLGFVAHQN